MMKRWLTHTKASLQAIWQALAIAGPRSATQIPRRRETRACQAISLLNSLLHDILLTLQPNALVSSLLRSKRWPHKLLRRDPPVALDAAGIQGSLLGHHVCA